MRWTFAFYGVLVVAGAFGASVGCSNDSRAPEASGGSSALDLGYGGDSVSCVDDPRVDTYTAELEKPGANGVLTFELVSSDPAPPAKDGNTWVVMVKDANGAPLGGDLGVALLMPDHGHTTQVPPVVTFEPSTNAYTIDPVYLFMPGVWRIELDYYGDSGMDAAPIDEAAFDFCIEG
jgi:hypothetical protein